MNDKKELTYYEKLFIFKFKLLRKWRYQLYLNHQSESPNPYERFSCCHTQDTFAEKINVERRTIGRWEKGKTFPSLDKIIAICQALDCDINFLLTYEITEKNSNAFDNYINFYDEDIDKIDIKKIDISDWKTGFDPSMLAYKYSGISPDIITYAINNDDYLKCLNFFMHPDNCSTLFNDIMLTSWKNFLSTNGHLDDLSGTLKSTIINIFHRYQAVTPLGSFNKESYKAWIKEELPPNKLSFSSHMIADRICLAKCLSSERFTELGLSDENSKSYDIFLEYIATYSFNVLTDNLILNIQKDTLGKSFVQLFEKFLSE